MLSIKKMGRGSEDYYLNLADYYAPGEGEPAGRWLGRGCAVLGLWGEVARDELKPLMRGEHPHSHRPLVQNAAAANRTPGWDFTFSAPKGVSIAWSQADPLLQQKIEAAHATAVRKTIELAEAQLAFSRLGKGGAAWTPVRLVVASFEHSTSRNLDQQLHTHCLVLNVGIDAAGQTRALYSKSLYVNRNLLGAYYRAELAVELRKLGFYLRRHDRSFEVEGIPAELLAATSTRRREIVRQLAKQGRRGGAAAAIATLDTRTTKGVVPPRAELFENWRLQNQHWGFFDVADILHPNKPQQPGTVQQAIDGAIARLSAERCHFSKTELIATALQEGAVLGLAPKEVINRTQALLTETQQIITTTSATTITTATPLVSLGVHGNQQRFSTPEVLAEEQALLKAATTLRERPGATVPEHILIWAIEEQLREVTERAKRAGKTLAKLPALSAEQLAAVRHLALDILKTGSLKILRGLAGTGKTDFVLAIVTKALQASGYEVVAVTPTAKAGRILARDTGLDVETVTKALGDYELTGGSVIGNQWKRLKSMLLGEAEPKPEPVKLHANSVLLVDEASMLTTRHSQMLLAHALENGASVILSGDPRQLPPVGRGAPLLSLAERIGAVELTNIQRQEQAWAREVAQHAARGEVAPALTKLAEHHAVRVAENVDAAIALTVARWSDAGGSRRPAEVAMIANTNAEVMALNQQAQQHRIGLGLIGQQRSVPIRDIDPQGVMYEARVYPGDQVLITKNDSQLKIANGMTGTVLNVNPISGSISLSLAGGGLVVMPARSFEHLRLGYAVTTHKVQGDTLKQVVVLVTETQQTLPAFYVQATRAKEATTIVTTKALWDPETQVIAQSPLAELLGRNPDLRLATDLQEAAASQAPVTALHPPLELSQSDFGVADVSAPAWPASAPLLVPDWLRPSSAEPAIPIATTPQIESAPQRYVAIPAAEVAAIEAERLSAESLAPPASASSSPAPLDPSFLFPPPPPKRRKKKRPAGFAEPVEEPPEAEPVEESDATELPPLEDSAEEEVEEPQTPVVEQREPLLPDEFLIVPLPNLADWSGEEVSMASLPQVLPRDFARIYRPPTGRVMPSRIRIPAAKKTADAAKIPQSNSVSAERAKDPVYRQQLRDEHSRAVATSAAAEHGVPIDQIEIIDVEQWDEETKTETDTQIITYITIWTKVTFRVRMYGPRDLLASVAFPTRL